jgi:hypothetical protein
MKRMTMILLVALAFAGYGLAETTNAAAGDLARLLEPFRDGHGGKLPDGFCVQIDLHNCMLDDKSQLQIDERFEFTPHEIRRLRPQIVGTDPRGFAIYDAKTNGEWIYHAERKTFDGVDIVCRVLLALDYSDLVAAAATKYDKLDHLRVFTCAGLAPRGRCDIAVTYGGQTVKCGQSCWVCGNFSSAQSLRFAALYHMLRHLGRTEFGLAPSEWADSRLPQSEQPVKPSTPPVSAAP